MCFRGPGGNEKGSPRRRALINGFDHGVGDLVPTLSGTADLVNPLQNRTIWVDRSGLHRLRDRRRAVFRARNECSVPSGRATAAVGQPVTEKKTVSCVYQDRFWRHPCQGVRLGDQGAFRSTNQPPITGG